MPPNVRRPCHPLRHHGPSPLGLFVVEADRATAGRGRTAPASGNPTKAVKVAHLELTINGKIEGLPVKTLSGDLTNVPAVAISGDSTITMGGSDIDIQLVVLGGTLYAALTPNNWLDMGPAADIYDRR